MCECNEPGFCPLHNLVKNKALFEHCKRGEPVTVNGKLIEPPSFLQKIANYTVTQTAHFFAGSPKVTEEIYKQRISICEECEYFDVTTRECDSCGCPMDEKAKMADVSCPLEQPKWKALIMTNGTGCSSCGKK